MFYSHKIKQEFQNILTTDYFQRLFRFQDKSIGAILMLHRINYINPNRFLCNEHLKISPEFLDEMITTFKKKGFSFISIDELYEVLISGKKQNKLLTITLDDGYHDNFIKGLPVFKQHKVPFTIYVSTGMIEKNFIYWWYLLEDYISQNNNILLSDGTKYSCKNQKEKERTFMSIRDKIIKINPNNLEIELSKLFPNFNINIYKYNDTLPLTWEQIKILKNEPLATIGSHTHSHIGVNFYSHNENKADILKSNQLFKDKANIVPKHFCYPYGGEITAKDADIIKSMGFKTAVTSSSGNIYSKHINNLFMLPRFFVAENSKPNLLRQITWFKYKNK